MALAERYRCGQSIRAVLSDLSTLQEDELTVDEADGILWRIEVMYREFVAMDALGVLGCGPGVTTLQCLAEAHVRMGRVVEELQLSHRESSSVQAPLVLDGTIGRPKFDIQRCQLEFLIQTRFSVPQIANLVGVSVSTVRRRMTDYNLSIRSTYCSLNDGELDLLVADIQQQFPNAGNRQMYGHLWSRGVRVQFHRVRESQSRIDPEGSFMRQLQHLYRRRYSVKGPQHLWHIDGNHKLIR